MTPSHPDSSTIPESERIVLRPTAMVVRKEALRKNLALIKAHVAPAKVMAVVKANAYGHGIVTSAQEFIAGGADYLGVAIVEEGVELRRAGISAPILIFGGIFGDQIGVYLDYDLDLTASSESKLLAIEEVAARKKKKARVHLKIDTGMGRIGIRPESASTLIKAASKAAHCDIVGIFSHLADADSPEFKFTEQQIEIFCAVVAEFKKAGLSIPFPHLANSAGILGFPKSHLAMVRPGISLYGIVPARHLEGVLPLEAAMEVKSKVVYFKVVPKGGTVSYGRTWTAAQDTRVVTVPIGYGDGYPRALSNRGEVLIRGSRYPIAGRVCMDQIMVALGKGEAFNGDEVTLIGAQGTEKITVEDIATWSGTVPYEILTMLNVRIPRVYV